MIILLYALFSTSMFYLGSRALITEALWTLYPPRFARLMDCAACTGFWWGLIAHVAIGRTFGVDVGPLPADHVATPLVAGLAMLVLTPILAACMHLGLKVLGSVVDPDAMIDGFNDDLNTNVAASDTQPRTLPAGLASLKAKLEALDGDHVLEIIDGFVDPYADTRETLQTLKAAGWSEDDITWFVALIKTEAQRGLIDGNAWRGRI